MFWFKGKLSYFLWQQLTPPQTKLETVSISTKAMKNAERHSHKLAVYCTYDHLHSPHTVCDIYYD